MPDSSVKYKPAKRLQAPTASQGGIGGEPKVGSSNLQQGLLEQQAQELAWLASLRLKHRQHHLEHAQVLHSGTETACSTRTLQRLAQTDLDWSEFKQAVPTYQLPHVQSSFALSAKHDATNDYRPDVRKPYMARTVSSKARSAGLTVHRCTYDSQIPVSAMYEGKQQAQISAAVEAECSSVRVNSMYQYTVSSVQPYLRAHTGGLAYTYGDKPCDQLRMTADLINSMREASSMPLVPKATSWIVAKSNLWPASAADSTSGLTAQKQAIAHQSQTRRM